MVVEIYSENCGVVSMSPRISFSHDFSQKGPIPIEKHPLRSNSSNSNSSIDFDFCVNENSEHESSSADELFSHGIILPTQIKKKTKNVPLKQTTIQPTKPQHYALPPLYANGSKNSKKMSTKDVKDLSNDEVDEKHGSNKSFWGFKRSSSCGSGYGRSLCPLPLISRSHSTGSSKKNSSTSRSSYSFGSNNHQKAQVKRCHGGAYGNNSVRVNPLLNVPCSNLFGFGSIFSKVRNKKK